jgi:hypothetical protein
MKDKQFYVHIIDEKTGKKLSMRTLPGVPRIGDGLRMSDEKYYKVTSVYWCFDEDHSLGFRINIGVKEQK